MMMYSTRTMSSLGVLLCATLCATFAILDVEGFGSSASVRCARVSSENGAARMRFRRAAHRAERRRYSNSMLFGFGRDKAASGRPLAGGTVKGGKKSKVVQEASPAVKRQQATGARSAAQLNNRKLEGVFTPPQFEAFQRARKEVPSGSGQAYWNKIAARVPGQNSAACKGMAESLLLEKAVGTKSNYFGGYIETKETPDYVDPDADVFVRLRKFFGKKKG